jgi:hypothetical protein
MRVGIQVWAFFPKTMDAQRTCWEGRGITAQKTVRDAQIFVIRFFSVKPWIWNASKSFGRDISSSTILISRRHGIAAWRSASFIQGEGFRINLCFNQA